jgi:hypothetical protein
MPDVTLCEGRVPDIQELFLPYSLAVAEVADDLPIPGSFWGECEAGLIGNTLYIRADTPIHSALHEGCHYICMESERRSKLHTDAAGDYDEENAVCYLQILLADKLAGYSAARMVQEMDSWGYSFRLGSARAWFEKDAEDARQWLLKSDIINKFNQPTWKLR